MIVVHHLNNSRSQRILSLLEELGVAYEVERYERDPQTDAAPAALRAVHPLGKSPMIGDGHWPKSGAIVEYLVDHRRGPAMPPAVADPVPPLLAALRRGSAMPPLLLKLVFVRSRRPCRSSSARSPARSQGARESSSSPRSRSPSTSWKELKEAPLVWQRFPAADIDELHARGAAARRWARRNAPQAHAFLERIHAPSLPARPAAGVALTSCSVDCEHRDATCQSTWGGATRIVLLATAAFLIFVLPFISTWRLASAGRTSSTRRTNA